jgi:hypothetical protein
MIRPSKPTKVSAPSGRGLAEPPGQQAHDIGLSRCGERRGEEDRDDFHPRQGLLGSREDQDCRTTRSFTARRFGARLPA